MEKTYVVFNGRQPGVYERWADAQAQVNGFRGACYKGYRNKTEALRAFDEYMKKPSVVAGSSSTAAPISSATSAPSASSTSAASSSSTSAPRSTLKKKQTERIAQLVDAQAELARDHQRIALRMEELSEELKVLLESLQVHDDD